MAKYLILLLLIAGLAGYAVYDMTPATKEVAVQKDRHIDSWGQTLEQATTTIEKNESTKFTKTFTDRPPIEEEVQEQAKDALKEVQEQAKTEETPDAAHMPPELNPGQEKNWEALQRHNQKIEEQQAQEPELDGGPPNEPAPPPPVPYGQYPCSYPDCPGNPDVENYLGKRWRWEGGGPQWYGSGGPNGVDVQAPFFQLHIRPWKGEWRRHWRNERRERW